MTYTARTSWAGVMHSDWILDNLRAFPGKPAISQPFWPEQSGGSFDECIAGAYDASWREFGRWLAASGRGDSYVRLGWEFSGDWCEWSATDPAKWKACYRRIATAIRTKDPRVLLDWTVNAHHAQNPPSHDAFDAYPGDDVVDVVGIDAYDSWPPSPDAQQWDSQCNGPQGVCRIIQFAREHGKKFSVGEWEVVTCGDGANVGGDNAFYVRKTWETLYANRDVLEYETYFSDGCHSLLNPDVAPNASGPSTGEVVWRASGSC